MRQLTHKSIHVLYLLKGVCNGSIGLRIEEDKRFMTPFILKGTTKIPPETVPRSEHIYDPQQQLWIDSQTGVPLVLSSAAANTTRFGETTITETREGIDQTETHSIHASRFGETTITKTQEGVDQSEITALVPPQLGETTVTVSVEDMDIISAQQLDVDAPYSHF